MRKILAIPQETLNEFIKNRYYDVLSAAKCPCSGQPKPCPSALGDFEGIIKGPESELLDNLFCALSTLQSTLEKNVAKNIISEKSLIQAFLEELNKQLSNPSKYSAEETELHVECIQECIS